MCHGWLTDIGKPCDYLRQRLLQMALDHLSLQVLLVELEYVAGEQPRLGQRLQAQLRAGVVLYLPMFGQSLGTLMMLVQNHSK